MTGNPNVNQDEEKEVRRKLVQTAVRALQTDIDEQTVFNVS